MQREEAAIRPPIKILARKTDASHADEELVGLVPGSFKQAMEIAADHVSENPDEELVIKRGEKILDRVHAKSLARPVGKSHERAA